MLYGIGIVRRRATIVVPPVVHDDVDGGECALEVVGLQLGKVELAVLIQM